jgi:hypothetical protein
LIFHYICFDTLKACCIVCVHYIWTLKCKVDGFYLAWVFLVTSPPATVLQENKWLT